MHARYIRNGQRVWPVRGVRLCLLLPRRRPAGDDLTRIDRLVRTVKAQGEALLNKKACRGASLLRRRDDGARMTIINYEIGR